jgi:ABC-type polysaccharide transport system permease subunit
MFCSKWTSYRIFTSLVSPSRFSITMRNTFLQNQSKIVQNIFTVYLMCILHNTKVKFVYKLCNNRLNGFLNDICDIFTVQNTIDNMMLGDPWDVELMENRTIRVRILFILLYYAFCVQIKSKVYGIF